MSETDTGYMLSTEFEEKVSGKTWYTASSYEFGLDVDYEYGSLADCLKAKYRSCWDAPDERALVDQAPKTLIVEIGAEQIKRDLAKKHKSSCPETFVLKTNEGEKEYKVVSTVETHEYGNHFVATLRTKQGWIEVDSLPGSVKKAVTPIGDKFKETLPATGRDWYRDVLIYELVS